MSDKEDLSNRRFGTNEGDAKSNFVELARSTGEPFDSIADRLETDAGDPLTAAKVRNLAREFPDVVREQRRNREAAEAAAAEARAAAAQDRGEGSESSAEQDRQIAELRASNEALKAQNLAYDQQFAKIQAQLDQLAASGGAATPQSGRGGKASG